MESERMSTVSGCRDSTDLLPCAGRAGRLIDKQARSPQQAVAFGVRTNPEPYHDWPFHDSQRAIAQPNSHGVNIAFFIDFLESQTGVAWIAKKQPLSALRLPAYVIWK